MEEKNKLCLHDIESGMAITVDRNDILEVGPVAVYKNGMPVTRLKLKREPKEGAINNGTPYYHVLVSGTPLTLGQLGGVPLITHPTSDSSPVGGDRIIDYEQRRWEAALAIISGLNANRMFHRHSNQEIASMAVRQADELIEAYTKIPNEWTSNNS